MSTPETKTYYVPASRAFDYAEVTLDPDNFVNLRFTQGTDPSKVARFHLYSAPDLVEALRSLWLDNTGDDIKALKNQENQLARTEARLGFEREQSKEFQERMKWRLEEKEAALVLKDGEIAELKARLSGLQQEGLLK